MYEVNQWLWQSGRGKPRLGGLSVASPEERRIQATPATHRSGEGSRKEG